MMCSRVSAIIVEAAEEAKKRTKFTVFAAVVWLTGWLASLLHFKGVFYSL